MDQDIQNGSGNEQANQVWHTVNTLASGGYYQYSLHDLTYNIFNDTFQVSFSGGRVRGFIVKNNSEDVGANIMIAFTGGNAFNNPTNSADSQIPVYPKSAVAFNNPIEGWSIGNTNHIFYIHDTAGSGVNFEIGIIGTSGG
jgi:hypothetical protein